RCPGQGHYRAARYSVELPRAAAPAHTRALPMAPARVSAAADRRQYPGVPAAYDAPPAGVEPHDEGGGGQGVSPSHPGVRELYALPDFPALLGGAAFDPTRRDDSQNPARPQLSRER